MNLVAFILVAIYSVIKFKHLEFLDLGVLINLNKVKIQIKMEKNYLLIYKLDSSIAEHKIIYIIRSIYR